MGVHLHILGPVSPLSEFLFIVAELVCCPAATRQNVGVVKLMPPYVANLQWSLKEFHLNIPASCSTFTEISFYM